ncbi:hypothetical protein K474DRAFT_1663769, partial [Panus rudis PR-1116 ss-1]
MSTSTLSADELSIVLKRLKGKDIVNAMCTCRNMYEMGLPILLGSPVELHKERVQQFAMFVLSDIGRFGPMLRDLSLFDFCGTGFFLSDPDLVDAQLSSILNHAVNLQAFKISDIDFKLTTAPHLMQTLLKHSAVQRISLRFVYFSSDGGQEQIQTSLEQASCPRLTHLELDHLPHLPDPPESWFAALSQFAPSLQSLTTIALPVGVLQMPFPQLTTLKSRWLQVLQFIPTSTIFRLFPQLRNISILEIIQVISNTSYGLAGSSINSDGWRAMNTRSGEKEHRWSSIAQAKSTVDVLHALAFGCPISVLDISRGTYASHSNRDTEELTIERETILECEPRALKLACRLPMPANLYNLLETVFEKSTPLSYLEWNLSFPISPETETTQTELCEHFAAVHGKSPCTTLRINVMVPRNPTPQGDFVTQDFDLDGFIKQLAKASPALRFLCIARHAVQTTMHPPGNRNVLIDVTYVELVESPDGKTYQTLDPREEHRFDTFSDDVFKPESQYQFRYP